MTAILSSTSGLQAGIPTRLTMGESEFCCKRTTTWLCTPRRGKPCGPLSPGMKRTPARCVWPWQTKVTWSWTRMLRPSGALRILKVRKSVEMLFGKDLFAWELISMFDSWSLCLSTHLRSSYVEILDDNKHFKKIVLFVNLIVSTFLFPWNIFICFLDEWIWTEPNLQKKIKVLTLLFTY